MRMCVFAYVRDIYARRFSTIRRPFVCEIGNVNIASTGRGFPSNVCHVEFYVIACSFSIWNGRVFIDSVSPRGGSFATMLKKLHRNTSICSHRLAHFDDYFNKKWLCVLWETNDGGEVADAKIKLVRNNAKSLRRVCISPIHACFKTARHHESWNQCAPLCHCRDEHIQRSIGWHQKQSISFSLLPMTFVFITTD